MTLICAHHVFSLVGIRVQLFKSIKGGENQGHTHHIGSHGFHKVETHQVLQKLTTVNIANAIYFFIITH